MRQNTKNAAFAALERGFYKRKNAILSNFSAQISASGRLFARRNRANPYDLKQIAVRWKRDFTWNLSF